MQQIKHKRREYRRRNEILHPHLESQFLRRRNSIWLMHVCPRIIRGPPHQPNQLKAVQRDLKIVELMYEATLSQFMTTNSICIIINASVLIFIRRLLRFSSVFLSASRSTQIEFNMSHPRVSSVWGVYWVKTASLWTMKCHLAREGKALWHCRHAIDKLQGNEFITRLMRSLDP